MTEKPESKRLRELRGLMSLKDFCKPLGVSVANISNIENGSGLSSDLAKKICDVYDVSMDWLFGRVEDRKPTTMSRVEEQLPLAEYKLLKENADLQKMVIELQNKLINKQTTELESLKNGESAMAK